jgi:putative sugar O-methyltransferase
VSGAGVRSWLGLGLAAERECTELHCLAVALLDSAPGFEGSRNPPGVTMKERIHEMEQVLALGKAEVQPSRYWLDLNRQNSEQLAESGFENFKRTIAKNYFTFMRLWPWDAQIRYLMRHLPASVALRCLFRTFSPVKHAYIPLLESWVFNFLTNLLWEYARRNHGEILDEIAEPPLGNPPQVVREGRLISQDLANSIIEYHSIAAGLPAMDRIRTICELGAGYGRNAYVFLKLLPSVRYVVIDIPPALYVAERYLSEIFPTKRVFEFRGFASYEEVRTELEAADLVFLLPSQMEALPRESVDLFINISSLHEMRIEQIRYYLREIERLTRKDKFLYLKEWKRSVVPLDNVKILESDYPVEHWQKIFWREAKVQSTFFEALLQKTQ